MMAITTCLYLDEFNVLEDTMDINFILVLVLGGVCVAICIGAVVGLVVAVVKALVGRAHLGGL